MKPPGGGLRPAPPWYLITFAVGVLTLPFLGIGLGGVLLARAGHDPFDSINYIGTPCLAVAFGLAYAMRLIFWRRSSSSLAASVRKALTIVMGFFVFATASAIVVCFIPGTTPGWAVYFIVLATLSQSATITWLVKYRTVE